MFNAKKVRYTSSLCVAIAFLQVVVSNWICALLRLNLVADPLWLWVEIIFFFQAKAQEELEKEQYRKFLAKFTAENFLKKVKKDDME